MKWDIRGTSGNNGTGCSNLYPSRQAKQLFCFFFFIFFNSLFVFHSVPLVLLHLHRLVCRGSRSKFMLNKFKSFHLQSKIRNSHSNSSSCSSGAAQHVPNQKCILGMVIRRIRQPLETTWQLCQDLRKKFFFFVSAPLTRICRDRSYRMYDIVHKQWHGRITIFCFFFFFGPKSSLIDLKISPSPHNGMAQRRACVFSIFQKFSISSVGPWVEWIKKIKMRQTHTRTHSLFSRDFHNDTITQDLK